VFAKVAKVAKMAKITYFSHTRLVRYAGWNDQGGAPARALR
jgi:hypothetical protein